MIFLSSCVVFDPNYEKKNVFCVSELKSELLRPTRRCLHGPLLLRGWHLLPLCPAGLTAEVELDSLKQKGAIKRTLFLDNHQSRLVFRLATRRQGSRQCRDFTVYLRVSVPALPRGLPPSKPNPSRFPPFPQCARPRPIFGFSGGRFIFQHVHAPLWA